MAAKRWVYGSLIRTGIGLPHCADRKNFATYGGALMIAMGSARGGKELRRKPRRQFHYQARILTAAKGPALPCSIADISQSGARLILQSEHVMPRRFLLLLNRQGDAKRICRLVWRDGLTLGVEFSEAHS